MAIRGAAAVEEIEKTMRILLVEDDTDLQRLLKKALGDAGYVVDSAVDGEEGHFLGDTEPYDAVILDLGLPKMDGVRVLQQWRKAGRTMPVLILTARDRWSDKVAGFDAGADDYLAKPFYTEELLARVRALLRRAAGFAGYTHRAGQRIGQSGQDDVARIPATGLSDAPYRARRVAHGAGRASLRPGFRSRLQYH